MSLLKSWYEAEKVSIFCSRSDAASLQQRAGVMHAAVSYNGRTLAIMKGLEKQQLMHSSETGKLMAHPQSQYALLWSASSDMSFITVSRCESYSGNFLLRAADEGRRRRRGSWHEASVQTDSWWLLFNKLLALWLTSSPHSEITGMFLHVLLILRGSKVILTN